jgi:uncharacterized protein (DUF1499 family)
MVQSGFAYLVALLLTGWLWLGSAMPIAAAPLVTAPAIATASFTTAPITKIAMGSKPLFSFSGKQPTNLGVQEGKLAACPNTPNCVSSQATTADAEHYITPIAYQSTPADAMAKLKSVIEGMERTKIIRETGDYLYAEFTSALMGYVDDVEFYLDPNTPGQLQVRSASRLGQSDLGVNRKRIEALRAKLAEVEA